MQVTASSCARAIGTAVATRGSAEVCAIGTAIPPMPAALVIAAATAIGAWNCTKPGEASSSCGSAAAARRCHLQRGPAGLLTGCSARRLPQTQSLRWHCLWRPARPPPCPRFGCPQPMQTAHRLTATCSTSPTARPCSSSYQKAFYTRTNVLLYKSILYQIARFSAQSYTTVAVRSLYGS